MNKPEWWIARNIKEYNPIKLDVRAASILEACEFMDPESWAVERYLAMTKWFDYRFLCPVAATLEFIEQYRLVSQMHWARSFATIDAVKKRGIAAGGLYHSRREFSTFWNARVHADSLGAPYRIYVSNAMEAHLRRAKQKRLPRPNQLRRADCNSLIQRKWEEELSGARYFSDLPHYRQENYCALPMQTAHQDHVASNALKRSNIRYAIAGSIEAWRILPTEKAKNLCGAEVVKIALDSVGGSLSPVPVERLSDDDLIPSCFGLPTHHEDAQDPCRRCPVAEACTVESGRIVAEVVARFGTDNPSQEHNKKMQRERQNRRREKLRAEKAAAAGACLSSTSV